MIQAISKRVNDRHCGRATAHQEISNFGVKTQGEIEAAICEIISRIEHEFLGRGPSDIRAHLIGDFVVVRLQGVLTTAEQQLIKSLVAEKGRNLLKQIRTHLIEAARPVMEAMIQEVTGVKMSSLHHDISSLTGEEVLLFTLADSPYYRQPKKRHGYESG